MKTIFSLLVTQSDGRRIMTSLLALPGGRLLRASQLGCYASQRSILCFTRNWFSSDSSTRTVSTCLTLIWTLTLRPDGVYVSTCWANTEVVTTLGPSLITEQRTPSMMWLGRT